MQFQSDVSDVKIERPLDVESTARGAAMLAGVGAGVFSGLKDAARFVEHPQQFQPQMTSTERRERLSSWQAAVERTRSRANPGAAAEARGVEEGGHGH
jgi:glycerol kinase